MIFHVHCVRPVVKIFKFCSPVSYFNLPCHTEPSNRSRHQFLVWLQVFMSPLCLCPISRQVSNKALVCFDVYFCLTMSIMFQAMQRCVNQELEKSNLVGTVVEKNVFQMGILLFAWNTALSLDESVILITPIHSNIWFFSASFKQVRAID